MSTLDVVTSQREIPKAPFYVCCNDSFMSGWGHAQGKVNTLIFPCQSYEEAEIVERNARRRSDQKFVRICTRKPKLNPYHLYQVKTRDTYDRWYQPNAF
jgi:hypothetical protein